MNAAGLKNRDIIAAPGRLWSLWDMLKQYARNFGEVMSMLKELSYKANEEAIKTRIAGPLMDPLKGRIEFWLSCTEIHARDLDLDNSIIESSTLRMRIEHGIPHGITPLEAQIGLQNLFNSFKNQTSSRKFFYVQPRNVPYYETRPLFGPDVFNNFSSANDDIDEAGKCLALGRGTACVMHLMRVLEVGLAALASALGVNKQNDWGRYLQEIDKELTARFRTAGARSADEQFYAEVSISIDSMRRAWRNPTMHPEKSYSTERAEEILLSIKSFMDHLATKLHD